MKKESSVTKVVRDGEEYYIYKTKIHNTTVQEYCKIELILEMKFSSMYGDEYYNSAQFKIKKGLYELHKRGVTYKEIQNYTGLPLRFIYLTIKEYKKRIEK